MLVDAAGCRGLTMGGAQVSEKHCNFLLNLGSATSADIEALGEEVRRRVFENSGVALESKIQRVGREWIRITRYRLMGGWSFEHEVSLTSSQSVVDALREHQLASNVTSSTWTMMCPEAEREMKPEVVFDALTARPRGRNNPGHARPDGHPLRARRARNIDHLYRPN